MQVPELPESYSFTWDETPTLFAACCELGVPAAGDAARWWTWHDAAGSALCALRPPLLVHDTEALPDEHTIRDRVDEDLGRYALLLLQAGAMAVALFDGDELLDHKAQKRYVVRGKGKAQPTYLERRGKSRLGSRIRLKNAQRLLEQVNERLAAWWDEDEPPQRLFVSCPVRLFSDLCQADPPTPVQADDPRRIRIPLDVHVPTHAELMRVHRSLSRGRLWYRSELASVLGFG